MAGLATETPVFEPASIDASQTGATPSTDEDAADAINAQLVRAEVTSPADGCNPLFPDFCVPVGVLAEQPPLEPDIATACGLSGLHEPTGALAIAPGSAGNVAADNVVRLRVEIEEGLAIDAECFAAVAIDILTDERGWTTFEDVTFARVDDDSFDFRLVLASPATTDTLCYPANTAGRYSCRNGDKVIINLMRWEEATDEYTENLTTYRHYLLNHEVGHFLGRGHLTCRTPGEPAPVMMQQTKGLGECLPNGWPTQAER